jgi:hypothetical protein
MKTPTRRILGVVLAAAFALSFAPAASAQTAPEKKSTASKKTSSAPAAATDPAPAPRAREPRYPFNVGLLLGPAFGDSTAFMFRIEGAMSLPPLSREVGLDLVLPMAFSFWGQTLSNPFFPGLTYSASYFRFDLVPTARFTFPVARAVTLYGDGGLGFSYYSASYSGTTVGVASSSGASGVFRLAGGGGYHLTDQWRLIFEPVGLNFYFGSGNGFAYTLLFGANYRF